MLATRRHNMTHGAAAGSHQTSSECVCARLVIYKTYTNRCGESSEIRARNGYVCMGLFGTSTVLSRVCYVECMYESDCVHARVMRVRSRRVNNNRARKRCENRLRVCECVPFRERRRGCVAARTVGELKSNCWWRGSPHWRIDNNDGGGGHDHDDDGGDETQSRYTHIHTQKRAKRQRKKRRQVRVLAENSRDDAKSVCMFTSDIFTILRLGVDTSAFFNKYCFHCTNICICYR